MRFASHELKTAVFRYLKKRRYFSQIIQKKCPKVQQQPALTMKLSRNSVYVNMNKGQFFFHLCDFYRREHQTEISTRTIMERLPSDYEYSKWHIVSVVMYTLIEQELKRSCWTRFYSDLRVQEKKTIMLFQKSVSQNQ